MSHGVEVYDAVTGSIVWSSNIRQTNIQVYSYFDLSSNPNPNFTCPDANDNTKVLITFKSTSFGSAVPSYQGSRAVNKTSTSFQLTGTSQKGWVIAVRVK